MIVMLLFTHIGMIWRQKKGWPGYHFNKDNNNIKMMTLLSKKEKQSQDRDERWLEIRKEKLGCQE